jgi:glycosyltransferase involved in cell wall biosynthesis
VHVTGWAWLSHFVALRAFQTKGIPTLFRGDSHLLDENQEGFRWWLKSVLLKKVFSWPSAFLVTGSANRVYYQAFGVEPHRLYDCPHSIDVARFSEPDAQYEEAAKHWRQELGIADDRCVILFAGKFERKKRPLELMRAVQALSDRQHVLVMIGGGELETDVKSLAAQIPDRFRVLPFQNQSRMPIVYRLGDLFVLPSAFGETWGLSVNEALACGRPVLVSDHVGCAADVVDASCGRVFASADPSALMWALAELTKERTSLLQMRSAAKKRAQGFDISVTGATLVAALNKILCREPPIGLALNS